MAGPKSAQTKFVGIIISIIHPYACVSFPVVLHLLQQSGSRAPSAQVPSGFKLTSHSVDEEDILTHYQLYI